MKDAKTVIGSISSIERMKNSVYGNPRFMVVINGEIYYTAPNSMLGYSIQNYANQQITVKITAKLYRNKMTIQTINKV